jgi:hypothetical protein
MAAPQKSGPAFGVERADLDRLYRDDLTVERLVRQKITASRGSGPEE